MNALLIAVAAMAAQSPMANELAVSKVEGIETLWDRVTGRPIVQGSVASAPTVRLEVRGPESLTAGTVFDVTVYAVALSGDAVPIGVVDIVSWTMGATAIPAGTVAHGTWLNAEHYNDCWLDGFNYVGPPICESMMSDGTHYYTLWPSPGALPVATPEGLPLVTFVYQVPPHTTQTAFTYSFAQSGEFAKSCVYSVDGVGGVIISDTSGTLSIPIVAGPATCIRCDINGDGRVDLADYAMLQGAMK